MGDKTKPIANPLVVLREEFDDWAILFNPDTADAVGINPVGVAVWKLIDGHHNPEEITTKIKKHFSEVPDSIIFRYSNVYGPRQDPYGEAGVVAIFINNMLKGKNPIINGDGNQTRDFVYISDAAKANLLALKLSLENETKSNINLKDEFKNKIKGDVVSKGKIESKNKINEITKDIPKNYEMIINDIAIFNIGTGIETSVNELFYKLKKITKANIKEIYGPQKMGELRRSCLNSNKAKEILGWEPKIDINQGLKLTVNYFKNG